MLTPANMYDYQKKAALHQLFHDASMLWLGCGLGKTLVTLTTIEHRMRAGQVRKTLVFGPLRVIHTVWGREAKKWSHLQHLRFSVIHGTEKKRLRQLFADADVYLCNYENMGWLSNVLDHYYISQGKPLPFDMVVYDEVTRVKNSNSQRITGGTITKQKIFVRSPGDPTESMLKGQGLKGKKLNEAKDQITGKNISLYDHLRSQYARNKDKQINESGKLIVIPEVKHVIQGWRKMIPHFKYVTALTGTPSSNGYLDLHGQYLVVDGGLRLGEYKTHYRDSYFVQGFDGWSYSVSDVGKRWIEHKIADITIKMDAEDYLKLPPLKINDIMIDLPVRVLQQYREVEKEMFTRLDNGTEIELFNRASVSNKCLQFSNGSPYNEPMKPEWTALHDEKLQALDSIVEEAAGKTILIGYSFKADAERIMKRYKHLKPVNLTKTPAKDLQSVIEKGCRGEISMMIGHPASLGHGIDGLNDFCHIIVWFGLPWSLELYEQLIGRIASGQRFKQPVTMHRILARNTIDHAVMDALVRKDGDQVGLKQAIQRYRDEMTPKDGLISFM
jgi:hypothetical protein